MLFVLGTTAVLFAQIQQRNPNINGGAAAGGFAALVGMFMCYTVVFAGLSALAYWKVFEKAGEPGWASLIPMYNVMVLLKIGGQNPLWGLLLLTACGSIVTFVLYILACIEIAKRFGQESVYAVGLILLGIVFFPILGFGSAQYRVPSPVLRTA